MQRKFNYIGIAIIVIAVAIIIFNIYQRQLGKKGAQEELSRLSSANPGQVILYAPTGTLPSGYILPSDFPEQNLKIIQSYTASYTISSPQQVTFVYISKLTMEQNFAAFKAYLQQHKWKIVNETNKPDLKTFNAARDDTQSQVIIAKTSAGVRVTVSEFSQNGIQNVQ